MLLNPVQGVAEEAPLSAFEQEWELMWWLQQSADWGYTTNMSDVTASGRTFAAAAHSEWMREWKTWARHLPQESPLRERREVRAMAAGVVFTDDNDARQVAELKSTVSAVYSKGGEGARAALMARVRAPEVLKGVWKSWRRQVAEPAKKDFLGMVRLTNKAAKENGYSDVGEAWRQELGIKDVRTTVLALWSGVKDLYKELHAYARHKLRSLYGDKYLGNGPWIPAHLLGSLWGEKWDALSDILLPHPSSSSAQLTFSSYYHLLRKAEQFYTTMGFEGMGRSFWINSMFAKPEGRLVDCHAMSYDFAINEDYRVRMCGKADEKSFMEAVHEFGHVHYFMAYHHLPLAMRSGANSAFHEAVGETMAYAAQSPRCWRTLQIQHANVSQESVVNTLMKQALSKFVFLPWALTIELWRYDLFSGQIKEEDMISKWWELRKEFQGVEPPDFESSLLFDPGSKYHVALNIPYMRYFLSRFFEHHFLAALCSLAGHDIHDCCFITSPEAGNRLKSMLSLGSSVPWQDALEVLTGQRLLSPKPLLDYYRPLHEWLIQYNTANNVTHSW